MNRYKILLILLALILVIDPAISNGQHSKLHVVTVNSSYGSFKGLLSEIADSAVEITDKKNGCKFIFPASQISTIKIRKSFLLNSSQGFAVGAITGGALVGAYYLKQYTRYGRSDPSDPPFGYALWTTMVFGAVTGFIYGSVESIFFHKKFHISNAANIFENNRGKLKKYLY